MQQQQHLQPASVGIPLLPKLLARQLSHVQLVAVAQVPDQAAREPTGAVAVVAAAARSPSQQLLPVLVKQEPVAAPNGEQQSLLSAAYGVRRHRSTCMPW
jgi:hypothetical protein